MRQIDASSTSLAKEGRKPVVLWGGLLLRGQVTIGLDTMF